MTEPMKLAAEWKVDFGNRQDYDGSILEISSRHWGNDEAYSSLILCFDTPEGDDEVCLARHEFDGPLEEVAPQVEAWAQAQMDRAVKALRAEFGKDGPE